MFLLDDIKYALRLLKKQPFFSALAVGVLAGGLAVSVYTFSLLQTAVYKDLPLPGGDKIVTVRARSETGNQVFTFEAQQLRSRLTTLTEIGLFRISSATLKEFDVNRSIIATHAEWSIFEFSRTQPLMGRGLVEADMLDGAEPVAVISFGLWQSQFGASKDILEQVVHLNKIPRRIVGVMPEGYAFPVRTQVWLPLSNRDLNAPAYAPNGGLAEMVSIYARLTDGANMNEAAEEFNVLFRELRAQYPRPTTENYRYDDVEVTTFQRANFGDGGMVLFTVLNVVAFAILLLSCANVGNMLLARTNERAREIAVRVALGAPRLRLIAQMSLESTIICVLGGFIALVLAAWWLNATNGVLHSLEPGLPYWMNWALDGSTIVVSAVFIAIAILLVSALPIWSISRINSATLLRDGTRGAQSRTGGRITQALVTLQIILISLIMVVGGSLTVIANRFVTVNFGIDSDRLLFVEANAPEETIPVEKLAESLLQFERQLLTELRNEPTLEAAIQWTPVGDMLFTIDNAEYPDMADYPEASVVVSSDAPTQIGGKLLEGRYFDHRESVSGARSVMVTKTLADSYWPGASPLGRSIHLLSDSGTRGDAYTVVGVIQDVLDPSRVLQIDARAYTSLILPPNKDIFKFPGEFLVRHNGNEELARAAAVRVIEKLNGIPARPIVPYAEELERAMRLARAMTETFEEAGLFALLLGLTGIYGLCRNEVIRRTQEIGLRRAIGATERAISLLLLRQSVRRLLVGVLFGGALSVLALFMLLKFAALGVPTMLTIGVVVFLTISALVFMASYFSARRVLKAEPAEALRYE